MLSGTTAGPGQAAGKGKGVQKRNVQKATLIIGLQKAIWCPLRAAMMGIIGMMIHEGLTGNPIFPIAVRHRASQRCAAWSLKII